MRVGYACIPDTDPIADSSIAALQAAGCTQIFTDTGSGMNIPKPEFEKLMASLQPGDTVVISKLSCLGRSTRQLFELVETFARRGIHFCSLDDGLDTHAPCGILVYHVFGALAEHERSVIKTRTRIGLEAARTRGRKGGRPKGLEPRYQQLAPVIKARYELGEQSTAQIMHTFGIGSRRTLYKILRFAGAAIQPIPRNYPVPPD